MTLHNEIAKIGYELYEKSGCIGRRDFDAKEYITVRTEKIGPAKPAASIGGKASPKKTGRKKQGKVSLRKKAVLIS